MSSKKLLLLLAASALVTSYGRSAVSIDNSNYRIGASHDGNLHDRDDFAAVSMEIALLGEAGIGAKLVHVDVNNHLGVSNPSWATTMWSNVNGAISRWKLPNAKTFNDLTNLSGAIASIKGQVNASSASNRFYLSCAGPMEVAWRGLSQATPSARQFCTAVSHSTWNDNHTHGSQLTHTWANIQSLGVKTIHIGDQNKHAFKAPYSAYAWLKNSSNPNWQWLYNRAVTSTYDASDAGTIWYIITGRGDQTPAVSDVRNLFDGHFTTHK